MTPKQSIQKQSAQKSAFTLIKNIKNPKGHFTIADASVKSGLSLNESEQGLHYLIIKYKGILSVTSSGDLLFKFPYGFKQPWKKDTKLNFLLKKVQKKLLNFTKIITRAWISIVLISYAFIFIGILIGMTMANKSSEREDSSVLFHMFFRVILDSLFWTFHPLSTINTRQNILNKNKLIKTKEPFYLKVNRFFFGPEEKIIDPLENQKKIISKIRLNNGKIVLFDIIKITNLKRIEIDSLMAKLMFDYNGEVKITSNGNIYYNFNDLQKTTQKENTKKLIPIWNYKKKFPLITGNNLKTNIIIGSLNFFNLILSSIALINNWTIEKIQWFLSLYTYKEQYGIIHKMPEDSISIILGIIPFTFSIILFILPLIRLLNKHNKKIKITNENGRREILKTIAQQLTDKGINEQIIISAFEKGAKRKALQKEIDNIIIKMGGNLEINHKNSQKTYRFKDFEIKKDKQKKTNTKSIGPIIFSSK